MDYPTLSMWAETRKAKQKTSENTASKTIF
jgi:hypothetical protein